MITSMVQNAVTPRLGMGIMLTIFTTVTYITRMEIMWTSMSLKFPRKILIVAPPITNVMDTNPIMFMDQDVATKRCLTEITLIIS